MNPTFLSACTLLSFALIQGCNLKDYADDVDTAAPPLSWAGGQFQMTSHGVTDQCADGGFARLLMPEGADTPTDWQHLIEIPAWEDMGTRVTYNISLQDPFSEMAVSVVQGEVEGTIKMTGGSQDDIPLFDDDSCFVNMSITATIQIVDDDNVGGQATFTFIDSTGMNCNFEPNCEMKLDFTGIKQ